MASKIAHFPAVRDLDGFHFAAQPSLDRRQIRELAACRWVAHGEALLLLARPASARRIWRSRSAGRRSAKAIRCCLALVAALGKAHAEGRLEERLGFFAKPKPLIIDELGYLPFETNPAHLFFRLISRRYECGSVLITARSASGARCLVIRCRHQDPRPAVAPQPSHHHPR